MKITFKIIGALIALSITIYLASIPYFRSKNVIQENMFYTPTKYDSTKLFNQLVNEYLTYIPKQEIHQTAHKFIAHKIPDTVTLNQTSVTRQFKEFIPQSRSEYYIIQPHVIKKTGIFMMGNQFNVFNLLDNLTELAKADSAQIYVIVYNGDGFSTGQSDFETQFKVNQSFYTAVNKQDSVRFIAGHSLGTVFATKLAVDNQIETLALLAPASNINDVAAYFKTRIPFYMRPYLNFSQIKKSEIAQQGNSAENIKNFYGNLLLFHGTKDEILPYTMSVNCKFNFTKF